MKENYNECFEELRMYLQKDYIRLYPRGLKPDAFYGNAKLHKLKKVKD